MRISFVYYMFMIIILIESIVKGALMGRIFAIFKESWHELRLSEMIAPMCPRTFLDWFQIVVVVALWVAMLPTLFKAR